MQRIDDSPDTFWKFLVYGKPGSGKSSFGASAPKPLILLSERQGKIHIQQAARRLGIPVPPILYCDCLQDYRDVNRAFWGDRAQPFRVFSVYEEDGERKQVLQFEQAEWPETVVIDTTTDVCRLISEEIRRQSPPKRGQDGLPVDSQRYWNVMGDRIEGFVHAWRDAPCHTVFLAQVDDREVGDEDQKVRQVGPDLKMRRLPAVLAASVNTIGYSYRREQRQVGKPADLVYGIMMVGPEYMTLKPLRPLRDVENTDCSNWIARLKGSLEPAPPAPAPSTESALSEPVEPAAEPPAPEGPSESPPKGKRSRKAA